MSHNFFVLVMCHLKIQSGDEQDGNKWGASPRPTPHSSNTSFTDAAERLLNGD
jgi:hypothetical protein